MKTTQSSISLPTNSFHTVSTEYITNDRTIEIILVKPYDEKKDEIILYMYNYKGIHFRIFSSLIELSNFLKDEDYKIVVEFEEDEDVDKFLSTFSM